MIVSVGIASIMATTVPPGPAAGLLESPGPGPMAVFALALVLVLIVPLLVERLRLPGAVGAVLAGMALGPYGANLVVRGSLVQSLGEVGLLYLLFLTGLQLDARQLRRARRGGLRLALAISGLALVFGGGIAAAGAGRTACAFLLLAALLTMRVPVDDPIVQQSRLRRDRSVCAAADGAGLCALLAVTLLAAAVMTVSPCAAGFAAVLCVVKAALLVTLILLGLPRLARWFFRDVQGLAGVSGFLFILTLGFSIAWVAPAAGLHPAVGAFLAGLSLHRAIPRQTRLMIRLRFSGETLFIPFFLLYTGHQITIGPGAGAWVAVGLGLGLLLSIGVVSWLAAWWIGRVHDFSRSETGLLFGLSVLPGTAPLVVAAIGVQVGMLTPVVLGGAVMMILAGTFFSRAAIGHYSRRLTLLTPTGPVLERSDVPERIMIPVSGPEQIDALMALAILIRNPQSEEALFPIMIVPEGEAPEVAVADAEKILAAGSMQAVEAEVPVRPMVRLSASLTSEVLATAREQRISTLVYDDRLSFPSGFEHVPDRLADEGRHLVFRVIRPAPIHGCRRIVVAVPPFMERQAGFEMAWQVLLRVATQAGITMLILADSSAQRVLEGIHSRQEELPHIAFAPLSSSRRMVLELRDKAGERDLCVLFLSRPGQAAWSVDHARGPRWMRRILGSRPCLAIYPQGIPRD